MISKWILNNFKSIDSEKELEFRPLTLFTGANSSGKSTVLQSILLIVQTLQSHNPSKAVVLNGHIKKFGTFEDIVNHRDESKVIKIGFELQNDEQPVVPKKKVSIKNESEQVAKFECNLEIMSDDTPDCVMPLLKSFSDKTTYVDGNDGEFCVDRLKIENKPDDEQAIISKISRAVHSEVFNYRLNSSHELHVTFKSAVNFPSGKVLGVSFQHFIPDGLVMYKRFHESDKEYVKNVIMHNNDSDTDITNEDRKRINKTLRSACFEILEQLFVSHKIPDDMVMYYQNRLKKKFSFNTFADLLYWLCKDDKERAKYANQLMKVIDGTKDGFNVEGLNVELADSGQIASFFTNRIKYLAPLREEPRALYPIDMNGDLTDIGLRGENTAAVYQTYQNSKIEYIPSSAFKSLNPDNMAPKKASFGEAVNDWLEYLGVAEEINTNDKGKYGHELKIQTEKGFEQDLTHVGVGASQVLPILVMALLARKGDVIILEQPELHLHPKVQTRLADFFVAMNALGKQCIIETHSEYMINRLRYFVAVNDDSKIADDTMIYFVEKHDGHSEYRPITINKYGVIEDWPEGFFDESERIAAQILRAGMEKRMKEEGNEEDDD